MEVMYFNPRSPHGERPKKIPLRMTAKKFQSTLPARGATCFPLGKAAHSSIFQSTLPARGATGIEVYREMSENISIHAPRTGSDDRHGLAVTWRHISIHAPRTGSDDEVCGAILYAIEIFQSTLPARGATIFRPLANVIQTISIHAPRTGSDAIVPSAPVLAVISIHAPRTGSDSARRRASRRWRNFNPRSPHGERLRKVTILSIRIIGFAQKVYHKTVLLRISLAENAVILPEKPRNPVRTSLQKAGGLRFARAIRAARPYSISSPSGA